MPKPYSYDLRQKVIQAIELDGMKKSEAAEIFFISRNTINLWLQRKTSTGDYKALPNQPSGNGHKITDWKKFREFVEVNGDKTQVEMAKLWPEEISERSRDTSCSHHIKSFKKNWIHSQKKTYGYP